MQNFRDLKVWQKAHQFVLNIYSLTQNFPSEEKFGLVIQLRRAAVSVAANIVEGFKRRGIKDSLNFYTMSEASLAEARYYLLLARDLIYFSKEIYEEHELQADEVAKMLFAFKKSLKG